MDEMTMTTADHEQDAGRVRRARRSAAGNELVEVKPIVKALEKYMVDNGLSMHDLADEHHLKMAYSTLSSALRGARPFPSDVETRAKVARMMGVPGLQVAIWCELLTLEDFVVNDDFEMDAAKALTAMRNDPAVSYFLPSEDVWQKTPAHAKIALILMYQTLTGKRFLAAAKVASEKQPATT